ncbi:unnamed protein product [Durusdinium trenchii]|uniref:Uncharacterized protein n=2 Tax=Durusdinium trenchii TaxID=1381693 RepID=A0ABP0RFB9_9DINO
MAPRPREAPPLPAPRPGEAPPEEKRGVSVSSLPSSIDQELLRAVPMHLVLAGCGQQWVNRARDEYHLSQRVNEIDTFLSHDWGTKRWLKYATLLVYFNSVPAALASLLMCMLVCVLIIFRVLDGWLPGTLTIHGAYWFVFVFWQNIRSLYKKNMAFLDRLCIAQHDVDLKKQGILSLGGVLSKSRKLVVLWSPRYFTRLWTAFELSSFLRENEGKGKDINFAPASMGPLLVYFSVFETLLVTSFHILVARYVESVLQQENTYLSSLWHFTATMLVICAPAFLVIAPIVLYLGTMQMKALLQLGKQLDDFKIRDAQCSCCQWNHCHPETGEILLCDRMLVFQTLKRWYPSETSSDAHLDRFDEMVHTELGGFVRNILGNGAPPLWQVLALTVHPLLGFWCLYVYLAVNEHLFP